MNESSCRHIVTLEDPIEFAFPAGRSSFSQRELGADVESFAEGLRGALRKDPDMIFVGEVRDPQTFDVALNAAESGHLVITTMHSGDTSSAIAWMLGFYPPEQQHAARERLAAALSAIVAQRLLPPRGSDGERVLVAEVYRRGPTIQDCVRDPERFRSLATALDQGLHELGTHSFDHQLLGLVKGGVVSVDAARTAASTLTTSSAARRSSPDLSPRSGYRGARALRHAMARQTGAVRFAQIGKAGRQGTSKRAFRADRQGSVKTLCVSASPLPRI